MIPTRWRSGKDYGQKPWQQSAGPTAFSPFPMNTKYFGSAQQAWMVNFRVRRLDAMVAQLRASGVAVELDSGEVSERTFCPAA